MAKDAKVKARRFPFWFRAFVGVLFATLLIPYALLRGGAGDALARSMMNTLATQAAPLLNANAVLGNKAEQPSKGEYRLNGMLVRYHTYWTPSRPNVAIQKWIEAAKKAGYATKKFEVQGQPAAAGIHPKSKVMISMIILGERMGLTQLRLAQQNLGELEKGYEPQLPGIPVYADGTHRALVTPVSGHGTQSLTYATAQPPAWLKDFYVRELTERGWTQHVPPIEIPELPALFFSKAGAECSIALMRAGPLAQTIVLVTLTEPRLSS